MRREVAWVGAISVGTVAVDHVEAPVAQAVSNVEALVAHRVT